MPFQCLYAFSMPFGRIFGLLGLVSFMLVLATCRDPSAPKSSGLLDLQREFGGEDGRLKISRLDVANAEDVADFGVLAFVRARVPKTDYVIWREGLP